ncbi:MAG: hypothetical protein WAM06_12470, partial [Methyloceanibacter sp.]
GFHGSSLHSLLCRGHHSPMNFCMQRNHSTPPDRALGLKVGSPDESLLALASAFGTHATNEIKQAGIGKRL